MIAPEGIMGSSSMTPRITKKPQLQRNMGGVAGRRRRHRKRKKDKNSASEKGEQQ